MFAYIEDNLKFTDSTDVVLGLRFDDHSKSGSNWSPSLNVTQRLNDYFTLKGGVAKAYKAPNMYQNAEGYLLSKMVMVAQLILIHVVYYRVMVI